MSAPPCGSDTYLSFCQSRGRQIPACEAVLKTAWPEPASRSFPGEVGFVDFFEADILTSAEAIFTFKDISFCMFPAIRPGDRLRVAAVPIQDMPVGEPAVFHRRGRIYCHRVVAKRLLEEGPALITRPDTSASGEDEPVFKQDFIGRAASIVRGGKTLAVDKKSPGNFFINFGDVVFILTAGMRGVFQRAITTALRAVQSTSIYKKAGGGLMRSRSASLSYSFFYPTSQKIESRFFKSVPLEKFSGDANRYPKWHLTVYFSGKRAGFVSVVHRPENCPHSGWWISDLYVRMRFRGLGLESLLLKQTLALLRRSGIQ